MGGEELCTFGCRALSGTTPRAMGSGAEDSNPVIAYFPAAWAGFSRTKEWSPDE